ncbi:MAG: hypothetical protein ABEI97_03345, partial [Candidatus Nanohaloarchaea archaeon]
GILDMGGNRIEHLGTSNSVGDAMRKGQIQSNFVARSGDTMKGNLDMAGYDLQNPGSLTNYYENACGANQAVKDVYANGTFVCGQAGGGLPTVLSINNSAGSYNLDMNGNSLLNVNTVGNGGTTALDLGTGGNVQIPNGNLKMSDNEIRSVTSVSSRVIEINGAASESFESASINNTGDITGGDWGTWYNNDGDDADISLGGNYKGSNGVQVQCSEAIRSPNINNDELQDSAEIGRIYLQAWVRQYNDNEYSRIQISTDGGSSYQNIKILDNNDANNEWSAWHRISIDITPYVNTNTGSKIYLKFQDDGGGCGDQLEVDEVQLLHAPNKGAWNTGHNGRLFYGGGSVEIPNGNLDISGECTEVD